MIRFLTVEEVIVLHAIGINLHGGTFGLRDRGLLESAVGAPSATFGGEYLNADLWEMAAAYAYIAEAQPFLDGNKRVALVAMTTFLDLNGHLVLDPEGQLYDVMIALANRRIDKAGIAAVLRKLSVPPG